MPVRITQKLVCKLTKDEIDERGRKASELDQERRHLADDKKAKVKVFNAQLKGLDTQIAELTEAATKGEELRDVECEERESLVNGSNVVEIWRLDTEEIVETIAEDPEDDAPDSERRQGALPFAAKAPPVIRCSAVNEDGECFPITAEQADALDRAIAECGRGNVEIDGRPVQAVKVLRGKACDTCGIVNGHRPECAAMKREEAGPRYIGVDADGGEHDLTRDQALAMQEWLRGEGPQAESEGGFKVTIESGAEVEIAQLMGDEPTGPEEAIDPFEGYVERDADITVADVLNAELDADEPAPDSYDRNDTSQVAAKIREVAPPNDKPLAPKRGVETATAKPKRAKRGAAKASEVQS